MASKFFTYVIPKIAKNLKSRRETFETMTGAVDKQYKKSGLGITDKGKKIKRDAALDLILAADPILYFPLRLVIVGDVFPKFKGVFLKPFLPKFFTMLNSALIIFYPSRF